MHCAVGPEQWEKGGHHGTWFPDGKRISMNLNIDREVLRFVQVNADGSELKKILSNLPGSGHPTVTPDGKHLLTDTYSWEDTSFGDGTIPLRWVDLQTGEEEVLVRINTGTPYKESVLRVDPHPAWDRTWRYVTFNAFVDGTRKVFIADLEKLID
jgi:Tol biopolymer transport system component